MTQLETMADPTRTATGYPSGYTQPQSNTAQYPNGYPPQPPYYNQNAYNAPYYSNPRANFIRRFIGMMIALFIIAGTILFIIWLVLRPRIPQFHVDSLSVSGFNISSSQVTGNWDVQFAVRNPNKKLSVYYDHIEASVYYRNALLSQKTLPPFKQGTKNQTALRATLVADSIYVDGDANDIAAHRTSGSVSFNVRVLSIVRFKDGAWRARRRVMRVLCGNLGVGISSNSSRGNLLGGSRQCRVGA